MEIRSWMPGSRPRAFHSAAQVKVVVAPTEIADAVPHFGQNFNVGLDARRPAFSFLEGLAARMSPEAYPTARTGEPRPRPAFWFPRKREFR